jgi:hypothetical protein
VLADKTATNMGLPKWGLKNKGSSSVFQFIFSTRVGLKCFDFPHFGKPYTLVASLDDHNQTTETLTTIKDDILKIANEACLKIFADDKLVEIKHKFRLGTISTLGVIFFLFGGLFLIISPLIKTSDTATKIIGIILGLLLAVFSILTLIRQVADGLQIKDHIVTVRHNLKQTIIPLSGNLKIKMKTEVMKMRRVGTLGSDFIIVTHFLQDRNIETPILKFQMDNAEADNAKKLGNELIQIINAKISTVTM